MVTGLVAATIAACLLASPAGAKVVVDKVTGQRFGIVPVQSPQALSHAQRPLGSLGLSGPTCDTVVDSACASPMTLHTVGQNGPPGPVQHGENVVLFFWDPSGFSSAPGYVSGMQTYVSDLASGDYSTGNTASSVGNPISVAQQYYDFSGPGGSKNFIPNAVRALPAVMDTDAYPASGCTDFYKSGGTQVPTCLTASQLFIELNNYIKTHNLPRGINTEYFIMTPPGVGSCDDGTSTACSFTGYCGWHTAAGLPSNLAGVTVYADMPYTLGTSGCDINFALSLPYLYTSGIDPVTSTFSHELAESMTDPIPGFGWYGSGGGADEIGDKCGYQYVTGLSAVQFTGLPTTVGGAYYNSTLNGHNYLVQMEYDNRAGGCNQWDTDTQPAGGAISAPLHPATFVPGSFSVTGVTDPAGIAYVNWAWGDGTSSRSTGTASIAHSFATAGAKTVTAIVTDKDGNELRLTHGITVAASPPSVAVHVPNPHPAPNGSLTVKVNGLALAGGTLGPTHNQSEMDLFAQSGAVCALSRKAEQSKVAAGTAARVFHSFTKAGLFSYNLSGTAASGHHTTVRFCGYVSRTLAATDARSAVVSYTTT